MGNRDVFNGDALVFTEVPKVMASKCSSKVGDDAVRETKSMGDIFNELFGDDVVPRRAIYI